jgi:hypothetical protein
MPVTSLVWLAVLSNTADIIRVIAVLDLEQRILINNAHQKYTLVEIIKNT